jgi:hypothetical protein
LLAGLKIHEQSELPGEPAPEFPISLYDSLLSGEIVGRGGEQNLSWLCCTI